MQATRLRVGPQRPNHNVDEEMDRLQSLSLSPTWSRSQLPVSPPSKVRTQAHQSRSPSRSPPLPALSPVRIVSRSSAHATNNSLFGGPRAGLPTNNPLDEVVPPLQRGVPLAIPTAVRSSGHSPQQQQQFRKFVTTPSKSDLSALLRDALQDLYEKRPADELLHLIGYLRHRVAQRDGISDVDGLESAEVQRLKEENHRLKRHMSPENADYAAMNELLSVDLQKKSMQLDEALRQAQQLKGEVRQLKKALKRERIRAEDSAVELVEQQWLREKAPEDIERALQFLFARTDTDGSGTISEQELRALLSSASLRVSEEEVEFMLRATEKNEDGDIDYDAFVPTAYHLLARFHVQQGEADEAEARAQAKLEQQRKDEAVANDFLLNDLTPDQLTHQLRAVYAQADANDDGRVSTQEMFALLKGVKGLPPFTMEEVQQVMLNIAPPSEDGSPPSPSSLTVSFEEFVPVAFTVLKRQFLNELDEAVGPADDEGGSDDVDDDEGVGRGGAGGGGGSGGGGGNYQDVNEAEEEGYGDEEEDPAADAVDAAALERADAYLGTVSAAKMEEILTEAFQSADKDGSGFLDREELQAALASSPVLRAYADPRVIDRLVDQIDTDRDGKIDYVEFIPLGQDMLRTIVAAELKVRAAECMHACLRC